MNIEQVLILLIGVSCGIIGWVARRLYDAVDQLRDDLNILQVRLGTDYVRYDRLQDALQPILKGLEEIKFALNHKVDKT